MEPHGLKRGYEEAIAVIEARLKLLFCDRADFASIIRSGLAFQASKNIEQKVGAFLSLNMFSEELLTALLSGGQGFILNAAAFIWDRFVANNLVSRIFSPWWPHVVDHQFNLDRIQCHLQNDTFCNLFAPPAALVNRYAGALVAIDVTKTGDQIKRGSGFLAWAEGTAWVITCRHNVDTGDDIKEVRISDSRGMKISVGIPKLSSRYDLAVYRLSESAGPYFRLSDDVAIFEEVYTLGYPYIPGAHPMVVGHRGELNGFAELYLQNMPALLISNLVSPGSSGCPVLVRDGHCIGMTVRWLEGEWDTERARFSVALPASKITEFIQEVLSFS